MKFGKFDILQLSDGLFQLTDSFLEEFEDDRKLESSHNKFGKSKRIIVSINVVVIRDENRVILCDTGIGTKYRNQACDYPTPWGKHLSVKEQLQQAGIQPKDVTHILMTHLHYDHAGGLTCLDDEKQQDLILTYPNAQVFIQADEWEAAQQSVYKNSKGYRSENWGLYQDSSNLKLVNGSETVVDGVTLIKTNGHTRGHQVVKIDGGDGNITGVFGDLIPTPSHFSRVLKMKFDYDPDQTKTERNQFIEQALRERWLLFFYHAPHVKAGYGIVKNDSMVKVKKFERAELQPEILANV